MTPASSFWAKVHLLHTLLLSGHLLVDQVSEFQDFPVMFSNNENPTCCNALYRRSTSVFILGFLLPRLGPQEQCEMWGGEMGSIVSSRLNTEWMGFKGNRYGSPKQKVDGDTMETQEWGYFLGSHLSPQNRAGEGKQRLAESENYVGNENKPIK